jgi:protein tyrosine phosphatase (PTP) superfamily phosphohydrolase (DUF442 family)
MVNRAHFSPLCKTLFAALFLFSAFPTLHAQVSASATTESGIARASFGAPAEKLQLAGVRNGGKISEALFRGAQPSPEGLAELKKLGVTAVVDLRGNRGPVARERAEAEALGMRFVNIPITGWHPPADEQVAEFLDLFRKDPAQKVFVHCYFGEDRTGVMVAAYRIAQQNWTADQAVAEMYSFGFHYHWFPAMKSYVRKFPQAYSSLPIFAAFRGPAPLT